MGEQVEDSRKLLLMALACVAEEESGDNLSYPLDRQPSRVEIWLAGRGISYKQYQLGDENK